MRSTLVVLLLLLSIVGYTRPILSGKADSLQHCLRTAATATDSIDALNELAEIIMPEDTLQTITYLNKVREIGEKVNYPEGRAEYYRLLAKYFEGRGQFEKSINLYKQSLLLYDELGNVKKRCGILSSLGVLYHKRGVYDEALSYYDSCRTLAITIQDTSVLINIGNNLGSYYWDLNQSDTALYILDECLKYCNEKYRDRKAGIYHTKGDIFRRTNFKIALEYYREALAVYEKNKVFNHVANVLNNIALIYYSIKDYPSAISQFLKVLKITEENNLEYETAMALNNLGCAYGEMHQNDSALYYLTRSLGLYAKMDSRSGIITSRASIGDVYLDMNNPDSAIYQYDICLDLLKEYKNPYFSLVVKTSIAKAWLKKKEYRTSVRYAREAYEACIKFELQREQVDAGKILSEGLSQTGKHKDAYSILSAISSISDTLYNESKVKELTELEMQYEFEMERARIEQEQNHQRLLHKEDMKRQKIVRNSIIIVCLLLLIILSILYMIFSRNRKANKEKEALLKEIHHRVKNNLQIVSSLLNIQTEYVQDSYVIETIHESQSRVKAMALIHQLLYQEENFMRIDFRAYLKQLVETLSDIFQKPGSSINTRIIAEKIAFDIDTSIPLGLIVNELVTNAYKYAFEDSSQGEIIVELKKQDRGYALRVSDNGKGLQKDFNIEKSHSMGLKLVNILTKQLNGKLRIDGEKGTTVQLEFAELH